MKRIRDAVLNLLVAVINSICSIIVLIEMIYCYCEISWISGLCCTIALISLIFIDVMAYLDLYIRLCLIYIELKGDDDER